jgi:small subunit ribosomal protein S6
MSVREYELVLMLDPETPDEQRDRITQEARQRIEGKGALKSDKGWGMRKLAYEIAQRTEADYRFFRFEGESPLLDELDHSLKITDGVLRFRIFKVDPESPVIEPPPPVALAGAGASRGPGSRRGEAAAPQPSAPPAEAPAAEAPAAEAQAETPESEPAPAPESEPTPAPEPEAGEAEGAAEEPAPE